MLTTRLLIALLGIIITSHPGFGQQAEFPWSTHVTQSGPTVEVKLTVNIPPGWHIGSPTTAQGTFQPADIVLSPSAEYTLTSLNVQARIKTQGDVWPEEIVTQYEGRTTFIIEVQLHQPVADITGSLRYLACGPYHCKVASYSFNAPLDPPWAPW